MASNTAPVSAVVDNINENHFFYEDEVLKFDRNGRVKFGLVLESYEPNGSENESEYEDSIKKGEIRVAWHPDGNEEIIQEQYIGLADRTLMPGNVVRKFTGKDTQKGYCREVLVSADVRIKGTSLVIKNVSSERLRPVESIVQDDVVCLDSWVGSTKSVQMKLVLKTPCGARVEVRLSDRQVFKLRDPDSKHRIGYFSSTIFYPGQILVGSINALENEKWITPKPECRNSNRSTSFVVLSVETEGVWVYWQCTSLDLDKVEANKSSEPSTYLSGDDLRRLKRLNLFESSMLQINDTDYLKVEEGDLANLITKSQWRKERSTCYDNYKILHNQRPTEVRFESLPIDDKKINFSSKVKLCTVTVHNGKVCNNCDVFDTAKKHIETVFKKKIQFDDSPINGIDNECGWKTEDDDDEEDDNSHSHSDLTSASSRCSSPTPRSSPKRSPLLSKKIKKVKKRSNNKGQSNPPKVGDEIVAEAIVVYSLATVVWQDGTIESAISSRHLYPIHHLDEHEFFPGDFVLSGSESSDLAYRNYGVIQKVDHKGRTAIVKWFRTYTLSKNLLECCPQFLNETETSVYDLKDHPDFQFRPGMIVLRVANFEEGDSKCAVGQVIDNYADGRVKVWWVNGQINMCWPQDLFEVGQPDESIWMNGDSENDDEWETESETSEPGSETGSQLKPQLSDNLERARVAMAHLEEIFKLNPNLENQGVVRKLLEVYKKCRFMDRLMNTSFFHEDNFKGLVERVRRGSTSSSTAARVLDHKNRLFGSDCLNIGKSPTKSIKTIYQTSNDIIRIDMDVAECDQSNWKKQSLGLKSLDAVNKSLSNSNETKTYSFETIRSTESTSGANENLFTKELQDNNHLKVIHQGLSKTDWGEGSHCKNGDLTDIKYNDDQTANSCCGVEFGSDELPESVCARLCALMKKQLLEALHEINKRVNTSIVSDTDEAAELDIANELGISKLDKFSSTPIEDTVAVENVDNESKLSVIYPVPSECFVVLENAPPSHKFNLTVFHPTNAQQFFRAVKFDHKLLRTSLPPGVWVRAYEDRMDLLSVMIEGPKKTPYEDGIFLFDFQLGKDYPRAPPLCHYISFCSDRLNPNLYEDGKVCVSLLGTWFGKGSEMWSTSSTLLQVIVSIQGLILVSEPYFNEAGYEKQRGTQQGIENSRMYNEMVVLKLVESMTKIITCPVDVFRDVIIKHFSERGEAMCTRIKSWMDMSNPNVQSSAQPSERTDGNNYEVSETKYVLPEFLLIPASRGFCLKLAGLLEKFYNQLESMNQLPLTP